MRVPFLKRISTRCLKSSSFYFVGSNKRIDQEIEESYKREQWNAGKKIRKVTLRVSQKTTSFKGTCSFPIKYCKNFLCFLYEYGGTISQKN